MNYYPPDAELGQLFKSAEQELKAVADEYGFALRLVDNNKGTWYFYPEVYSV